MLNHLRDMALVSLDPRITRLAIPEGWPGQIPAKDKLDQFVTWEVFHQKKEGTPFVHAGPVHAPDADLAFLFAKEQFGRRGPTTGLWLVETRKIMVSPYAAPGGTPYEFVDKDVSGEQGNRFEIFHQKKRGAQHHHVGSVNAANADAAFAAAKKLYSAQIPNVNVWVIFSGDIYISKEDYKDFWSTTPEKKYRDAVAYRVQEKIEKFKKEQAAKI